MHNVYLGVMKQLLKLWIKFRKKKYSIKANKLRELNKNIVKIGRQLPKDFSRTPRPFKNYNRYKATELRQLLLYTMPILLKDAVPTVYYNHFMLLHCAIRILCSPNDCLTNNALAEELLSDFVVQFEKLYKKRNMSHNVHSVQHLAKDVLKFQSPLDDYSAFRFENFLQYLKKVPKSCYRVLQQINNRYYEKFSVKNYSGDFKETKKLNKFSEFGEITDIYENGFILSTKAPDNYVLVNEKKILKIDAIEATKTGEYEIFGRIVQNLQPFYVKPINSMNLNIFISSTESYDDKTEKFILTKNIRKVASLKFLNSHYYCGLLH